MSSLMRRMVSAAKEVRVRGLWGTMQAIRGGKLGMSEFLVGEDRMGNKYYSNPSVIYGRDRWVEYKELSTGDQLDAMKIPPEWHMWLHRMIDEPPSEANILSPKYQGPIVPNLTGTPEAYVPEHNPRSKKFIGKATGKVQTWDPSASRSNAPAADEKDVLDLK